MSVQPLPTPGRRDVPPVVRERFLDTLDAQCLKGLEKYNSGLQTHNGRDAGQDAWEELVDLAQYLTQLRLEHADVCAERDALRAENEALRLALERDEQGARDGTFGAHLRDVRRRTGVERMVLAARLGVSPSFVWRLESGERHPTRALLASIAGILALGPDEVAALYDAAGYPPAAGVAR